MRQLLLCKSVRPKIEKRLFLPQYSTDSNGTCLLIIINAIIGLRIISHEADSFKYFILYRMKEVDILCEFLLKYQALFSSTVICIFWPEKLFFKCAKIYIFNTIYHIEHKNWAPKMLVHP